ERCVTGGRAAGEEGTPSGGPRVALPQDRGFAGERVPLSGAARGSFGGDISVPALGRELRVEAKCRGNGFNRLYDWLEGRDFLVLRACRKPLPVRPQLDLPRATVMAA